MRQVYELIMNDERNPLNALPRQQRFQIMTFLSTMWTTVFCASFGAWYWFDQLLVAHLLLAAATLITGETFRQARRRVFHRDYPRADGTARYDDVWGA